MKVLILMVTMVVLTCQSCKREPSGSGDKKTEVLSQQMMDYFVNYEVGTKWVYQDTSDKTKIDTIELISQKPYDVDYENSISKGYELYYKPKKAKDFSVITRPGLNKQYSVKIYKRPHEGGLPYIGFGNIDGKWSSNLLTADSLHINGSTYYNTVQSQSGNGYFGQMIISKSSGIVYYKYNDNSDFGNPNQFEGTFKLIKVIKP